MSDTTLRYLAVLRQIPVYPKMLSTQSIAERLNNQNIFKFSLRTLQRDLTKLSLLFPITCQEIGKRYDWFWRDPDALTQIPEMNPSAALALRLVEDYMSSLLPVAASQQLTPYFNRAKQVLKEIKLGKWSNLIYLVNNPSLLQSPAIKPPVQATVYEALLDSKQLEIVYRNKIRRETRTYCLQPFGIVVKDGTFYLVAGSGGYDEPNHYCLHRIQSASILPNEVSIPHDFDLKAYVTKQSAFAYPQSKKPYRLKALFSEEAGFHLTESKLSKDQNIERHADGRWLVKATVANTKQLRWWLMGFGSQVEILLPKALRNEFIQTSIALRKVYQHS